jgi:hypothetical protein
MEAPGVISCKGPLNILHLSDELLLQIFGYVRGGLEEHELYFFDNSGANIEQIKSLRQTCRRFCETSSHLLLRYIKVHIRQPSIAHLEEVSRHPTISKGIRAIQVILCFYDSVLASNLRAFATYQVSRLRSSIESWELAIEHLSDIDQTPKEVYQTAIAKALSIARSWEDAAIHGIWDDCADHVILRRAQERYKQYYEDQKILLQGSFVQAIASAMARMPTATWLETYDYDYRKPREETFKTIIFPTDIMEHELLLEKLIAPMANWEDARVHGLGQPPAEVIPKLLLTIHEEGVRLTGLTIWTPPPEDLSLLLSNSDENSKIQAAVKHLKVFDFHPWRMDPRDDFWASREPDEWRPFSEFLSRVLSSTAIQRINLDLDFLYTDMLPPLVSMGPTALSHPWPKLENLTFSGPFHFEELQNLVRRAKKKLHLHWSGDLMSGSWAEVLDFLKESVLKQSVSYHSKIGTVNGRPSGAECDEMTEKERKFIFHDQFSPYHRESLATRYIRGWPKSNPVTDWERGKLDILDESQEDET